MLKLSPFLRLMRIHRPIGIGLVFLPCLFGVVAAVKEIPDASIAEIFRIVSLFFAGAVLMRSAGCVMNDLLDREIDAKVERTKSRPLAAKEITVKQAMILLIILLSLSLLILLQFNFETIMAGCLAFALVALYPLMKRITFYPQLFLGIVFNFGLPMSYLAIMNSLTTEILLLYFVTILWTVIYDTIYAFQDIEDDLKIGVKSTAIAFRKSPKAYLLSLSIIMFGALLIFGAMNEYRAEFFLAVLLADMFLNRRITSCDFANPKQCLKVFKDNFWFGVLLLIAILLG